MSRQDILNPNISVQKRLALSQYISLLLAVAIIVSHLSTVGSIEILLRPALISQVSTSLENDTQKRIQSIDAYMLERLNDIQSLSQSTPVKNLLLGDQGSKNLVFNTLFTAQHRDVANYISWSLLDVHSKVVLSYPSAPQPHGTYLILPDALQQLQHSGQVVISNVFYSSTTGNASVDLYARVLNDNFGLTGFVRASLGLSRVWALVNSETQANGPGSYGFILDQNGIRIAYTDPNPLATTRPTPLFKAVGSLSAQLKQRVKDENLYGNNLSPVGIQVDQTLADTQKRAQPPATFQINPVEQNQTFEAARASSTIVPWTYFILKPLNAVTGIVDQQLLTILVIVTLVLVIALSVGVITAQRIAQPILRSVTTLQKNSRSLKTLANEEHVVANEQTWMNEASQAGFQSMRYYTQASSVAVKRISVLSNRLEQKAHKSNISDFSPALKEITEAAKYIELAISYQDKMNEKLLTTLRLTTRATEQLTKGAEATDEAAEQLEYIVNQLASVIGKRDVETSSSSASSSTPQSKYD